ncbi:MAG TPA: class I SAM-dependent methyltransferase [Chitinophagales bacterium]|nr:class I SAM-dependent methyltransferase [Chitinophagales bacterium]
MMNLKKIENFYNESFRAHGIDPKSVGWTKPGSQQLRFEKLLDIIEYPEREFTLNELGCGYGELYKYSREQGFNLTTYHGYDISKEMIDAASEYIGGNGVILYQKQKIESTADYTVTSGIFNVKFDTSEEKWTEYVKQTLLNMAAFSSKGIAFNLLTTYVDYKVPHLYYADPSEYFEFCKKNISKYVNLIHDYELFEWTIHVKKFI